MMNTALRLPAPEIEALLQGRIIAVMPNKFITPGREFALCPADASINLLPVEQYYCSRFLPIAQSTFAQLNSQGVLIQPQQMSLLPNEEQLKLPLLAYETVLIKAWGRCELCQILNNAESLAALSQLTIWTTEALKEILRQKQNIFLAYLRVYKLPKSIEVLIKSNSQFVALPQPVNLSEANPVINDRTFTQRKHQLEKLEPSLHRELEELQSAIASLSINQPAAKQLDDDIKVFLGWSNDKLTKQPDPNLAWINDIAKLGDRIIEQDESKSNYQAGTDFEIITRRSLNFLGFKVEENYKGGAGGLDLFCSQPYPLVCECKAGKSIPDRAVEELDRIGKRHLKENYLQAVRLIIGPGQPTKNLKESAQISKISIINVMTLQKLVELKAKYPGAINLIELQQYLEPGQIDYKISEYIDKVEREIKLRSHIIQLVKNHLEKTSDVNVGVDALHIAYIYGSPPESLKNKELYEILIELSSPLTGYLGRIKGSDWNSDRFYFLRDLPIN
ncbi:hypothetical protein ANSO36C_22590 [Nostoc cf. commune SO-36]|uniref:DUF1802 domain-containing protein n=1 Tax=Nostoc cf. commune SO-36 TaxID=449208 RepID=A0ABM7Z0F9_NOSCO|nr:DUF1802 family protein [Nostoc commune]BDI16457.1 hypothetical protein ANSO36C_22590 [Nostoc cf. commune SO-36]